MNIIDAFLNRITMYRLVLYYLAALLVAAVVLGIFHLLSYSPASIIFSAALALAACWSFNELLAWFFKAPSNPESTYITALILALIVAPVGLGASPAFLLVSCVVAIGSKYLITFRNKHFFNPAALGVAGAAWVGAGAASWWVGGNLPLLPFILLGGLLLVRKLQRFDLVLSFAIVALATIIITTSPSEPFDIALLALEHTSLFFFAFVMLTEPLTTPPTRRLRIIYGAIVGVLFAPGLFPALGLNSFSFLLGAPEQALVWGNLFSFAVSPKGRVMLTLKNIERTSDSSSDFIFESDRRLAFSPGQYMEWTLPHKGADARGVRRYFTIASSPTQKDVRLGVKFYDPPSTFKKTLAGLIKGSQLSASEVRGDFTLPSDTAQTLVFVAGGIGVTPFRSMLEYMLDKKEKRPIVLLYAARLAADFAYRDLLERAKSELGVQLVFAVSDERATGGMVQGPLNRDHIRQYVPDLENSRFYLSGPRSMVTSFERTLRELNVPRRHIKTDFFPGFV